LLTYRDWIKALAILYSASFPVFFPLDVAIGARADQLQKGEWCVACSNSILAEASGKN